MKVAFVLAGLSAGGAERVISKLAAGSLARGWEVTIVTFDRPGDPIFHPIDPRVSLIRLALPTKGRGLSAWIAAVRRCWALRRTLQGRFDVVISFLTKVNVLTLLATRGGKMPVIVSERNNPDRQPAHPLWRFALRYLYPRAASIVMLTHKGRERLRPVERKRAVVIPNPVCPLPYGPRHDWPPQLVAVGRLNEQKGFDLLIAAFASLAERFPDWNLVIFGEGPDRSALEAQVASLGLTRRIGLPGCTAHHGEWIESATLFVLSSRYEGFANVVGEAMQAGLAVVAYDCDFGPSDLIEPNVSGLLVPPENVNELSNALAQLMSSPADRERLGSGAVERVKMFRESAVLSRWMQVIENAHA
ncbi:glycosyltransferase family 4 protein [Sphingobium lactosutens]|uniref:glycosyltransferase family 4 protein n=1 Tax=Sphingobium lactosutens TaxID=522773 RepID=UPI0015BC2FB7|nr:glycosyltransferase family 4 protein [Sphingobium lactosutens]NWK98773.1 glycosyltransferase family 4 protein [Sphingobium lactosutens]